MSRFATLIGIGGVVFFVLTAVAASVTPLARHPRIAFVLLLIGPATLVVAFVFGSRKPRKRRRR